MLYSGILYHITFNSLYACFSQADRIPSSADKTLLAHCVV